MKLFLLLIVIIAAMKAKAEDKADKNIYSGGMHILQPSLVNLTNLYGEYSSIGSGIGGIMRFYIGSNFAAGIYGGSLRANYDTEGSENSYVNLGHGGLFIGFTQKYNRWRFNASAGVGRGSLKNLHIEQQQGSELLNANLFDTSAIVYVPFGGFDYEITKRLLFTTQISYFMADNMNYQNTVLQIGLLFNR